MKASLIKRLETLTPKKKMKIIKAKDSGWDLDYEYKTPVNGVKSYSGPVLW